jgi:hypothetical protein
VFGEYDRARVERADEREVALIRPKEGLGPRRMPLRPLYDLAALVYSKVAMRVERLFKVLVLGGAALGGACGNGTGGGGGSNERGTGGTGNPGGTGGTGNSGGASSAGHSGTASTIAMGGRDGAGPTGGGSGTASASGGAAAGEGGSGATESGGRASSSMGGGSGAASTATSGRAGEGGADHSSAGTGAAGSDSMGKPLAGAPGTAGAPAELECRINALGYGHSADPCGCPCCWARDCLNTDERCCAGFCRGGDQGLGCCDR